VQHYGYRFDYTTNAFDPDPARATPLPALFAELADRAYRLGLAPCVCDQLTINEYPPGGGISAHVDTHSPFEDGIVSVSLGAHTVLDFRHRDGAHVPVLIPRRSVFVMTGAARYDWTHAISQRKGDVIGGRFVPREARTSLTWRRIRTGPCPCAYPALCDAPASSTRAIIKAPQDQDHTISRLQTGQ
jgi:alkylated DNA repair protein alkB family protein 8